MYTHVALQNGLWSMGGSLPWCCLQGWWGEQAHLGAHTPREVYAGYTIGVVSVWLTLF